MDLCYQGHADGRYSKLLTKLNHSGLLLLDDWGLEPLSSEQRSDLLEIVDLMYQRGSIIVLGQLPVESWYKPVTVGLFTVDLCSHSGSERLRDNGCIDCQVQRERLSFYFPPRYNACY